MAQNPTRPTEVVLPAASLAALRRSLVEQLGPTAAAGVLQHAGHAAGDAFYAVLAGQLEADGGPGGLSTNTFWRRLNELLASRGWGQMEQEDAHPGVGSLRSVNWSEADDDEFAGRPSCFFTTGLLANILGHIAGREVGVFEVECRSNGDPECRFLFGGQHALRAIYESVAAGQDVNAALAGLG